MNTNEPVAWYAEKNDGEMVFATSKAERGHLENKGLEVIPLYTHPHSDKSVKAKTLTDEEILQVHYQMMKDNNWQLPPYVEFARAILQRASEK